MTVFPAVGAATLLQVRKYRIARPLSHHPTVLHDHQPVGHGNSTRSVRNQYNRLVLCLQPHAEAGQRSA